MAVERAERSVQSVERALDVLEAVAAVDEVGGSELARRLGLHVATVHNLLRTLTARHYLLNAGGRYRLGPAASLLATRWDPLQALPDRVQPRLVELAAASGEAASATVLVGYQARLIAFQPGTAAITIHFPQWLWPQALKLATGRLLVALGDEAEWPAFVARSPEAQPHWGDAQWQAELARLRAAGCCALRTNRDGGQVLFAAPLLSRGGQAVSSIGVACPAFRADPDHCRQMTAVCWRIAYDLSRDLGGLLPPEPPPIPWEALPLDEQGDEVPRS